MRRSFATRYSRPACRPGNRGFTGINPRFKRLGKQAIASPSTRPLGTPMTGRNSRQVFFIIAGIALASVAAVIIFWRHTTTQAAQTAARPLVPVTVATATVRDVPIYYGALGTIQALNTVAIRAQVNGQLVSIDFNQGQEVHKGDVLARIDPAPFKAALDQAMSKKSEDNALLVDDEKDLARFN